MIPIRDANPGISRPVITWLIIVAAAFVFFFVQPHGERAALEFDVHHAAIPCELSSARLLDQGDLSGCSPIPRPPPLYPDKNLWGSVFVSMFLHATPWHLIGNLWVLWIFGNNVEDAFGKPGYVLFYLTSGVAATAAFVASNPSALTPLIGASGAIAGVMGAYLVLYPRARVVSVFPILFFLPIALPASIFLVFWFVGQFFVGATGIAWQAHVGGFLFGVAVATLMRPTLLRRVRRGRIAARR
ncbi:MAG TPA: rhomboid family intramembrane serine protease [Actinobacteria bacterium]|nr:rhomboid family protein [bacterium BMS3Bbin01]HDH25103.1 rhomboid family intramembrane serine protease [Actinomycetota bacterium]HDK45986.1 rhomboid family intramembrane serine protease [Actinomycetota bacterium]HDL48728.1 rhomboid family intramembrane serine protease [Actinomycetota bacterium]